MGTWVHKKSKNEFYVLAYDVKIGPHYIKTVIDDENLYKLSFFKTCFTYLTPPFMVTLL